MALISTKYYLLLLLVIPCGAVSHADLDDLEDVEETIKPPVEVPKPENGIDPVQVKPSPTKPDLNPELKENTEKNKKNTETEVPLTSKNKTSDRPKKIRTAPEEKNSQIKHPVKLKSLGLRAQKNGGIVELQKEVVITQGPLSLNADFSKVFLDAKTNEVISANAEGNVKMNKISSDPTEVIKATAKNAVFLNKERKVILTGDAKLWRGGNLLKGRKIVYDLASGWITFDRAEGIMQPERK